MYLYGAFIYANTQLPRKYLSLYVDCPSNHVSMKRYFLFPPIFPTFGTFGDILNYQRQKAIKCVVINSNAYHSFQHHILVKKVYHLLRFRFQFKMIVEIID